MWPTWLLQAFEFTIPALESSRTVEANTPMGEGGRLGFSIKRKPPRRLWCGQEVGGRVGEVSPVACVAGVLENSDGSRGQAGDGNA